MQDGEQQQHDPAKPPPLPGSGWIRRFCWWWRIDRRFACGSLLITVLLIISLLGTVFLPLNQSFAFYDRLIGVIWLSSFFTNQLLFGLIAKKTKDLAKKRFRHIAFILNLGLVVPNFFLGAPKSSTRQKLEWECDGIITEHYVSNNHRALAIKVSGTPHVKFEGIMLSFYEAAKVGDVIVKKPWDESAELNGERYQIVDRWEWWPFSPHRE